MPQPIRRSLMDTLFLALAAYAVVAGLAWLVSERMIFPAPRSSYADGAADLVRIEAGDGVGLAALWLPAPEAAGGEAPWVILFSQGNGEDLGHVRPLLEPLRRAGFGVLAWEYRGYGLSEGRATEASAYRDIEAVYRHLTDERGVPPERVLVYGRSVGSGPSVDLAARVPVGGLVVESGFATAFTVMTRVPLFPFDRFRNEAKIGRVDAPVLIVHGTRDEVVPFSHGQRLFAAAREPKSRLWVDAGHNDLWSEAGGRVLEAVVELRRRAEASGTSR